MNNLNLDNIVDVIVNVEAPATPRDGFNIGLIIGSSGRITTNDRCKLYQNADSMVDDGFLIADPEYLAASLYFSQTPRPSNVAIGAWDKTSEETLLDAVRACRAANQAWYGFYPCEASDAEIQALAAYAEQNRIALFYNTSEAAAKTSITTDIFSVLKGLSYTKAFGLYCTKPHAAAAAMGIAMGSNTGLANSAYTMAYKTLVGIETDDLTANEVSVLKGKNANVYIKRGGTYTLLEQGVVANGYPFDEVLGLDQMSNDIQIGVTDLLANTKTKIPYTDAGVVQFVTAINIELDNFVNKGFIAPGIWQGPNVLDLETGDAMSTGYSVQAETVASQTRAVRESRQAPPIYVCAKLAGAIEHAVIMINIDR